MGRGREITDLTPAQLAALKEARDRHKTLRNPLADLGDARAEPPKLRQSWEFEDTDAVRPSLMHELRCFFDSEYRLLQLQDALKSAMRAKDLGSTDVFQQYCDDSMTMSKATFIDAIASLLKIEIRMADVDNMDSNSDDTIDVDEFHEFVFSSRSDRAWRGHHRRLDPNDDCNDMLLLKRDMLRYDPVVLNLLRGFWVVCDKDGSGSLDRSEYVDYHMHLYASLNVEETRVPGWEKYARRNAEKEWENDTAGKPTLDQYRFQISLFQIVDAYIGGDPSKVKVAKFLCFLLDLVTVDRGDSDDPDDTRRIVFRWETSKDNWLDDIHDDAMKVSSNADIALHLEDRIEAGAKKMIALAPDLKAKQHPRRHHQKAIDIILDKMRGPTPKPKPRRKSKFGFMATTLSLASKQQSKFVSRRRKSLDDDDDVKPRRRSVMGKDPSSSSSEAPVDRILRKLAQVPSSGYGSQEKSRRRIKSMTDFQETDDVPEITTLDDDDDDDNVTDEPEEEIQQPEDVPAPVEAPVEQPPPPAGPQQQQPAPAPAPLVPEQRRTEPPRRGSAASSLLEEILQQQPPRETTADDGAGTARTKGETPPARPTNGDALIVTRISPGGRSHTSPKPQPKPRYQLPHEDDDASRRASWTPSPQLKSRTRRFSLEQNLNWVQHVAHHIGTTRMTPSLCALQSLFLCDTTSSFPSNRTPTIVISPPSSHLAAPRVPMTTTTTFVLHSNESERALPPSPVEKKKTMKHRPQTAPSRRAQPGKLLTLDLKAAARRPSEMEVSAMPGFLLTSKQPRAPTPAAAASARRRSLADLEITIPTERRRKRSISETIFQRPATAGVSSLFNLSATQTTTINLAGSMSNLATTSPTQPPLVCAVQSGSSLHCRRGSLDSSLGGRLSVSGSTPLIPSNVGPIWESSVIPVRRPSTAFTAIRKLPTRTTTSRRGSRRSSIGA